MDWMPRPLMEALAVPAAALDWTRQLPKPVAVLLVALLGETQRLPAALEEPAPEEVEAAVVEAWDWMHQS